MKATLVVFSLIFFCTFYVSANELEQPGIDIRAAMSMKYYSAYDTYGHPQQKWHISTDSNIVNAIQLKYGIPDDLKPLIWLQSSFNYKGKTLVVYGVDWRKLGRDSLAAKYHIKVIEENCKSFKLHYQNICDHRSTINRPAYAIFNDSQHQLIAIPEIFNMGVGKTSIFSGDIEISRRANFIELIRFTMQPFGDVFKYYNYGLSSSESRTCLSGQFGWSDFNGDGVDDFFVVSGAIDDDVFASQIEPKEFGMTRVRVAVLDVSSGKSVPIVAEEIFSYEMKYTKGDGLYWDNKLYWGDFNGDKKFDYMVRRRQADLTYSPQGISDSRFKSGDIQEGVEVFLGTAKNTYQRYDLKTDEKFTKTLLETASWEIGFPSFDGCEP